MRSIERKTLDLKEVRPTKLTNFHLSLENLWMKLQLSLDSHIDRYKCEKKQKKKRKLKPKVLLNICSKSKNG